MKRFLTMFATACALFAVSAQNPMVTLSHDGELTFFTNLGAFDDAISKAEDNDIIYVSEGIFTSKNTSVTINKRIKIVGTGYNSQLLFRINVNMIGNPYVDGQKLCFDGVKIQDIYFITNSDGNGNATQRENIGLVEITNSYIENLYGAGFAGKELTINKCFIGTFDPSAVSQNYTIIKNSKIRKITSQPFDTTGAKMTLQNCHVWASYYIPTTVISSIILYTLDGSNTGFNTQFHVSAGNITLINSLFYKSSLLPTNYPIYSSNCYYNEDENYFDEDLECILNLEELGYLGQDGTVIGIHGGDSPFTENPSAPTIDSTNSSVEYDSENNKLKVNITVKAD